MRVEWLSWINWGVASIYERLWAPQEWLRTISVPIALHSSPSWSLAACHRSRQSKVPESAHEGGERICLLRTSEIQKEKSTAVMGMDHGKDLNRTLIILKMLIISQIKQLQPFLVLWSHKSRFKFQDCRVWLTSLGYISTFGQGSARQCNWLFTKTISSRKRLFPKSR